MRLGCLLLAALFGTSCVRDPGNARAREDAAVTATPSASVAASADAPRPPLAYAPAASSAPRAEREARVLALLRGEIAASELPEVATEIGEALDPGLRGEVAPRKKSRVDIASVEASGALTAEAGKRALEAAKVRLRGCYARGLELNPNLAGGVRVELAIAADGRVMGGKNTGADLPDMGVAQCVLRRASALTLPASDAGTTLLRFRAQFSPD